MGLLPPFSSSRRGKVPFPFGRGHRVTGNPCRRRSRSALVGFRRCPGYWAAGPVEPSCSPPMGEARGTATTVTNSEGDSGARLDAAWRLASGAVNGVTWTLGPPGLPADFKFQQPTDGRSEDPSTRTANPDKHEAWRNLPVETTTLFVESLGGRRPMKNRSSIPHGDSSCFAWLGLLP